MKTFVKKLSVAALFILLAVSVSACGREEKEEELQTIEQQAIKQKHRAEDAMDAVNEQTQQLVDESEMIEE